MGQMPLVRVMGKARITLPVKIREALGINEGDYLEAEVKNNRVALIPRALDNKMESVELSPQGEQMLKESLEDVRAGRIKAFDNLEDLIGDLKK